MKTLQYLSTSQVAFRRTTLSRSLLIGSVSLLFAGSALAQTEPQNVPVEEKKKSQVAMISHAISRVTISRKEQDDLRVSADEGDMLNFDDVIRTGEDSAVRIIFADGTAETLCENQVYRVLSSGSEIYEKEEANRLENVVAAIGKCNIRPRFITRCDTRSTSFGRSLRKAGERNKVGGGLANANNRTEDKALGSNTIGANNLSGNNTAQNVQGEGFTGRCTQGEELFANYVYIGNPEPQTVNQTVVPAAPVPVPTVEPVTVPETGGSPVR